MENLCSFLAACTRAPGAAGQVLLATDGSDWWVAELVQAMGDASGRGGPSFPFPVSFLRLAAKAAGAQRAMDSLSRPMLLDGSAAWQACGWTPPVRPAEALRASVRAA
ncbi:hypothetical protein [Sorangium sp. So ce1097]|uniref:hypothetical protein n=1 Tax=Sorangium sp. So ce1097 TaxID=3133330 RepID=UPI003F6243A0